MFVHTIFYIGLHIYILHISIPGSLYTFGLAQKYPNAVTLFSDMFGIVTYATWFVPYRDPGQCATSPTILYVRNGILKILQTQNYFNSLSTQTRFTIPFHS